jgi:hypothetical protein
LCKSKFIRLIFFPASFLLFACHADIQSNSATLNNVVLFIGSTSFDRTYDTGMFFWSDKNTVSYTKFSSSGHISIFYRFSNRNLTFLSSLIARCKASSQNNSSSDNHVIQDYQNAHVKVVQFAENEIPQSKNCFLGEHFKHSWFTENINPLSELTMLKDMPRGKYLRVIPYFGDAKIDIDLLDEKSNLNLALANPYQFIPSDHDSVVSVPKKQIGEIFFVRLKNRSYALSWYEF